MDQKNSGGSGPTPAVPQRPSSGQLAVPQRQPPASNAYSHDFEDAAFASGKEWGVNSPPTTPAAPATPPAPTTPAVQTTTPAPPPQPAAAPPLPGTSFPTPPPITLSVTPTPPPPPAPKPDIAPPPRIESPPSAPTASPLQATPAAAKGHSIAAFAPTPKTTPEPLPQAFGNERHVPSEITERLEAAKQQNSREVAQAVARGHHVGQVKGFLSFGIFIIGIFVAAFLINQFIFQSYYVEGSSMSPTLHNDDRLIIDKVERSLSLIQGKPYIPARGHIVVLDSTIVGLNGETAQLIKRVIGLPGDTIHIENGVVTIKNAEEPEGFNVDERLGLDLEPTHVEAPFDITITEGQVFVMGDNRVQNASNDSRSFGPVEADKLEGRLWARILPLNKAALY